MHLIDAKCNNRIITSLFHFASTLATQNVIKKSKCNNYYIITKRAATMRTFSNLNYYFYSKMTKFSSSAMLDKGLYVISHIGRRPPGVKCHFCLVQIHIYRLHYIAFYHSYSNNCIHINKLLPWLNILMSYPGSSRPLLWNGCF